MGYFKKMVQGLSQKTKETDPERSAHSRQEAPLAYWEEYSYMSALLTEDDVLTALTEDIFANIEALEGIELKHRKLPGADGPGQALVSYQGLDFAVGFFPGDFSRDGLIQWQVQYFSEREKEEILKAGRVLTVFMKFAGDPQKAYHLQLKLVYAMAPAMIALFDESAERLLNRRWVELAAASRVLPSPDSLYTVQAVSDETEVWLHTHGLCRCGLHELEILGSNRDEYGTHGSLITNYACRLLDREKAGEVDDDHEEGVNKEVLEIGRFYDGEPILVSSRKWTEGLRYYPETILGGLDDRRESHNSKTNIIFLYGSEEDRKEDRLRRPSEFTEKIENNPIFFVSNEETERMSSLARERFPYVVKMLREKQEERQDIVILLKLGLATVDSEGKPDQENREHIWFEALSMEGDCFRARLTQEPYNIPNLHEGDEGVYSLESVSDWRIHTEDHSIAPETAYLLDL